MNLFKTLLLAGFTTVLMPSSFAFAADLEVNDAFARASHKAAKAGAAFMEISNKTDSDITLVNAEADVSEDIELHTHLIDANGVMRMREVEGGIPIPAGETVYLQPGGLHIMFLGLKEPLVEGESFPLVLIFDDESEIETDVKIVPLRGTGHQHDHHSHDDKESDTHHDHHNHH